MKDIKVLGIDLAKNVFQIHGADLNGKCKLRKRVGRQALIEFMGNCTPCIVGIEASGGSHYWARLFKEFGHTVWLGLVPKQHSSGNRIQLGGISKRGDRYARTLLVHGARSVIKTCENKTDKKNQWCADKKMRLGFNKAAVALANKNARIIWAILATGEAYRHYQGTAA